MDDASPDPGGPLRGREFPSGRLDIAEELADRFCRLMGEKRRVYTDAAEARRQGFRGRRVPPTVVNFMIDSLDRPEVDPSLGHRGFHGSQSLEVLGPICVGDRLEVRSVFEGAYAKTGRTGTMTFVVWENRFVNQEGELVVRMRESFVRR